MATSGNYRNFKVKNGVKYVHTINPHTGYPEENNTLSVTVVANNCALADAYATAFMVLGVDEAYSIAESLDRVEAYFIYVDEAGDKMLSKATPGLADAIQEIVDK